MEVDDMFDDDDDDRAQHAKPAPNQITSGGDIPPWTEEDKARLAVAMEIVKAPRQEPAGLKFGKIGQRMTFSVGNQRFTLDYKPDDNEEFEFMARMLTKAVGNATPQPCPSCEPVRLANLDCMDHFNALKADYDDSQAKVAELEATIAIYADTGQRAIEIQVRDMKRIQELEGELSTAKGLLVEGRYVVLYEETKRLEADRDTWKARAEFSFGERTKLEAEVKRLNQWLATAACGIDKLGIQLDKERDRIKELEAELSRADESLKAVEAALKDVPYKGSYADGVEWLKSQLSIARYDADGGTGFYG